MTAVINELLFDLAGVPRYHLSVFPTAVAMLGKVINEEGDKVLAEARALQQEMKVQHSGPESEKEPSFENPPEDLIGLEWRNRFSEIYIQDENGELRTLY
ncbi:Nn.00g089790.m01.CDS01 [Neocucurbitaria sp. VM-36]